MAQFLVSLYDIGNNHLLIGGDTLLVTISGGITQIETFDNKNGTYTVEYQILVSGVYTLSVRVNNDSTNIKSSTILVVPNIPTV